MINDLKKEQHFWHMVTSTTYIVLIILGTIMLRAVGKLPSNISVFDFFLLIFATFRITRLLVHDLVLDFVRDQFENATHGIGLTLHDLLDCPWCTGAWVALGLTFLYFLTPLAWPFVLIMGIAGLGTLLSIVASMMMVHLEEKTKIK